MAYFWSQKHHQTYKERPEALLILNIEINVSYIYISEKWMKKVRSLFSNLLNSRAGSSVIRSPEAQEADGTHCQQNTLLLQGALTPTPTLRLGQFSPARSPHQHIFGMWEETRGPGANPSRPGRTCKLHTHSGPSQKQYFSCHFLMKGHWTKSYLRTCCTTLRYLWNFSLMNEISVMHLGLYEQVQNWRSTVFYVLFSVSKFKQRS